MLVATHKAADVPADDFYLPIHVGHARNPIDLGYQTDDQGENISALNHSYCELTALYWAWKNLDVDYVGLSHYRRYFRGTQVGPNGKKILSASEARELMSKYDLVLAKPRNYFIETIESHYRNGHYGSDLEILREEIADRSPQFLDAYDQVFSGRQLSLYNMMIMSREQFDDYCIWLFDLLDRVSKRIDNESRTAYQQRTFGYLGERLLNVWATDQRHQNRIANLSVINTDGEPKIKKAVGLAKRKLTRSLRAST